MKRRRKKPVGPSKVEIQRKEYEEWIEKHRLEHKLAMKKLGMNRRSEMRKSDEEFWKQEGKKDSAALSRNPTVGKAKYVPGVGAKKDAPKYTGTEIIGVATMHKSNAVPILKPEHAEEVAKMRR